MHISVMASAASGGSPGSPAAASSSASASGGRLTYAEEKKFIEQLDDVRYSIAPGFVPGMVHLYDCFGVWSPCIMCAFIISVLLSCVFIAGLVCVRI
jgi:hypothetical protein